MRLGYSRVSRYWTRELFAMEYEFPISLMPKKGAMRVLPA